MGKKAPAVVADVMAPGIHLREKAKEIAGSKSEMSAMTLILITFLGPADIGRLCMRLQEPSNIYRQPEQFRFG